MPKYLSGVTKDVSLENRKAQNEYLISVSIHLLNKLLRTRFFHLFSIVNYNVKRLRIS